MNALSDVAADINDDLEEVIILASVYPELAAQSLPELSALSDRFCDFVGGLEERSNAKR